MDKNLKNHVHILDEIRGIPEQLRKIFMPSTERGLAKYLANIIAWKLKRSDRRKAYALWHMYKDQLPDSARKWPLRKLKIAIKIIDIKKRKYGDDK